MTNKDYEAWIRENCPDPANMCEHFTKVMVKIFPELKRVRGHYTCLITGRQPHWWLVTTDGDIVDPTKAQFLDGGLGQYEPWDESLGEPSGKCPNCGGYCFNGAYLCSTRCEKEYADYCNGGLR